MPGSRDRNLRSGDLHEELGLLLLKMVALVAPVPRPEDVGVDAFVTLLRSDGKRRLLPDQSFMVQLKAASTESVRYAGSDEVAWLTNLEFPLFIGRVDLATSRIELFSTNTLNRVLLEKGYEEIRLLLNPGEERSESPNLRQFYTGPPAHAWSLEDAAGPDFLDLTYSILRPHVEALRQNRQLRAIQYHRGFTWETGGAPVPTGNMTLVTPSHDIRDTLREMVPHLQRMLWDLFGSKRYSDFPSLVAMVNTMRKWGVDPDPESIILQMTASMAQGPELCDEDVIKLRCWAGSKQLNLENLQLSDESLSVIPAYIAKLNLKNVSITDSGLRHVARLTALTHLNLSGTNITDAGLDFIAGNRTLVWLKVERTRVTEAGIERLRASLPNLEVIQ